ncbi:MAG: endonuclease [Myxococcota bacterium]
MAPLFIAALVGLTAEDVLNKVELFSVRGDGRSCGMLAEQDRAMFRGWKLDEERTSEERGIFGLYNPSAQEQLVLFFASGETCAEVLGVLEARELITSPDDGALGASANPDDDPTVQGNPRDLSASDAREEAQSLGLFPSSSLWCACDVTGDPSLSCQHGGERREVSYAPVVPVRVYGPTFEPWRQGATECQRRGQTFSGRRCADRVSLEFRRMVSDLYNWAPQMIRASYLDRDLRPPLSAACEENARAGTLRPAKTNAGPIARAYLYMHRTYPSHVPIEPALMNVLERWHRENPPSAEECAHGAKIKARQGNANPLLDGACSTRP